MSGHQYRRDAPLGIQALAFLTAIDGVIAIVEGIGLLGALPVGLLFLGIGAAELLVAYGLYELEPYAYPLGMAVLGIGLVADLLTANVVGAATSGLNMYVLYRNRGLFDRGV